MSGPLRATWLVLGLEMFKLSCGLALPKIALEPRFPKLALTLPVGMVESPDGSGRFFILEQSGRIVVVRKDSPDEDAQEFLNLTNRNLHVAVEDGLLGLAFHPGFASNGLFYIYYCLHDPPRTRLSELRLSPQDANRADLASERVLLEVAQPFEDHKAGQLGFGPDRYLYIGLGDGGRGNDPYNNSQNAASLLGKILRIDVNTRTTVTNAGKVQTLEYGIPPDNPFVGEPDLYEFGVRKEIWAYGLRNPWRFSWDRQTGELWAADVGQDKWEEVDRIVKGGNYGWSVREGAHHFKPGPDKAQYVEPVIEYPHDPKLLAQSKWPDHSPGLCIIGGYVYRGRNYPALQGVYLYADYALGTIWGFRAQAGQLTEYGTLLQQPRNITSFAQDSEGELYVVLYDGHVLAITVPP